MNSDTSGQWFETFLDVVSVVSSFVNFIKSPSWGTITVLAYDCAAAVAPIVPASGTLKAAAKAADALEVSKKGSVAKSVANATGSYRQLINAGKKDAHHIIQDAAMREIKDYNRFKAPAIQLSGPSTLKGTPHNIATSIQRQAGGGTYGAERRIGYKALRRAGLSVDDAKSAIRGADRYFMDELGLTLDSMTRIPGNR